MIQAPTALHVLADTRTTCNLASGITAILISDEGPPVRRSRLLLLGALCDSVDGTFARRSGNPTERGATGDHIADFVTFGIAPGVILAGYGPAQEKSLSRVAAGLFIAAAACRKVRYGTGPRTSHAFQGLPDMGAGLIFALGRQVKLSPRRLAYLTLGLAMAMVSPIRVLSGEGILRNIKGQDLESVPARIAE